ncbi:MAG: hflK [Betaproteobacteria bacterium]|jgi:membrane protease subunit HflK|nr:hflK [Betaproteobacteria bacterium]MEA3154317.1 modulator of FtsH protease HflK [Betaproteobacteria bacterium]
MPSSSSSLRFAREYLRQRSLNAWRVLMSLNDPNWGRRPGGNQGPPDLEELWRNFNRKLEGLFGRRGADGGTGGGSRGPRRMGGIGLLVGLVFVVWLASGFYIVPEGQRGVVLRFGKYVETTMPGPRWHLPYPIESAEVVNLLGVRTVEVGYRNNVKSKVLKESLMLTDDENIIDVQFAVQYVLKSPNDYLFNSREPDESVLQAAETAVREIVGKSSMDFVLYEGRAEVASRAHKLMQSILDRYGTGINISKVTMQNAQPPEQVQAAFDDAVRASQDRERQKNEGQAYANDVIPKARGMAARIGEEAEGYRQRVIEQSEGDAARFRLVVGEYSKAPQVTRDRLYIEAMQQILSNTSKVVIDQKAGNNILYLPLDKLMQMAGPIAAEPPKAAETTVPQEPTAARSRDAFRSRDRESR